jgi:hypothetical protein
MRKLHPLVRLIARLLFGFSVLALFGFIFFEMTAHYFQGAAERTVRQAFTENAETRARPRYDAVCRGPEFDRQPSLECDPIAVKANRSLRSTSCSSRGFLQILGRQWSCVAKFTDGARLNVHVSLGFGRRHLELELPFREPDARDRH